MLPMLVNLDVFHQILPRANIIQAYTWRIFMLVWTILHLGFQVYVVGLVVDVGLELVLEILIEFVVYENVPIYDQQQMDNKYLMAVQLEILYFFHDQVFHFFKQ